jgi:rhamnosyltransferase subunit B
MPLRILLAAVGSSGDVNPVVGLGCALKARGHEVTLATNDYFADQAAACGLGFASLGSKAEAQAIMADPRLWHPRKGFGCIVEHALLPSISRLYKVIEAHRGPGLVVAATTLCLGARVAQEKLGVPTATLHLQPTVFRSLVDNGRLGPFDMGPTMPRPLKQALFWLMDTLYAERLIGPGLNAFRATLGLAPVHGIFSGYVHSPQMVLGLFPEWFAPLQPDWPAHTHLTGFILHDDWGEGREHARADAFLDAGPAPLVVTPGSAATDRVAFFRKTIPACQEAGVRAMLVTNHPAQLPRTLPEGIEAFPYLPFSHVLPRCAGIIYHGGIGTLAQAVRAGVPHIVVANAHDQPDNGQRIERLGLGYWFSQRGYSRRKAARGIGEILNSDSIRHQCAAYAPKVDSAAAEERACVLIEQLG